VITVRIPQPLRGLTGNESVVKTEGADLSGAITNLDNSYPGMKERLLDENGQIRRFVNIYVNGEDVRFMSGLTSALKDGDEVSIVPAVAGGC
jgi:sulfur-carrier protein